MISPSQLKNAKGARYTRSNSLNDISTKKYCHGLNALCRYGGANVNVELVDEREEIMPHTKLKKTNNYYNNNNESRINFKHLFQPKKEEVKYFKSKMKLNIKQCHHGSGGVYIKDIPNMVSIGFIGSSSGLFISDKFGGCDFTIIKTSHGIIGPHVFVEGNAECRKAVRQENLPDNWEVLYTWKSLDYINQKRNARKMKLGEFSDSIPFIFVNGWNVRVFIVEPGYKKDIGGVVNEVDDLGTFGKMPRLLQV